MGAWLPLGVQPLGGRSEVVQKGVRRGSLAVSILVGCGNAVVPITRCNMTCKLFTENNLYIL
jgi:hypothetical protein